MCAEQECRLFVFGKVLFMVSSAWCCGNASTVSCKIDLLLFRYLMAGCFHFLIYLSEPPTFKFHFLCMRRYCLSLVLSSPCITTVWNRRCEGYRTACCDHGPSSAGICFFLTLPLGRGVHDNVMRVIEKGFFFALCMALGLSCCVHKKIMFSALGTVEDGLLLLLALMIFCGYARHHCLMSVAI
ncbi:hypothetical protein BDV33DRAFT_139175 [Aspergillus novoparasiticus]|uniref:Uncharacterized protein n=1 Tax=Aspergillus novoparasiticus TaxID=986946 RepID=A0A5N6EIQ6_9EURO|nr:hypothetical protein BDV33DRAFT_139175 [Aspergillus novoparasiticus]